MKLAVLKNQTNVGKLHTKNNKSQSFYEGSVKHIEFHGVTDLANKLVVVANNPKHCVAVGHFPRNGKVVPKDKATLGDMTRTKDVVDVGNILIIDNDTGAKFDIDVFKKYWDIFEGAGYVIAKSGSTLLGSKKNGSHTYFLVKNGIQFLHRSMELLEAICIIEGYGKIEFYKTGKAVVKTPIDLALSQSSRLVYEDDTNPTVVKGGSLDLMKLPKNYESLLEKANKIKNKMLGKVEDKSLKLHKKYVKENTGIKLKGKSEIKESLKNYNNYVIDETFRLHLDGKYLGTVADLLLGKLGEQLYFSDLYEPDYGGGSQKALYYPESRTFFSQAHGGIKYTIEVSEKFNNEFREEFLKELPHFREIAELEVEMVNILDTADEIEFEKLVSEYKNSRGGTVSAVKKKVDRLKKLKQSYDINFDLWMRGDYKKSVSPEERLKHYINYKNSTDMVTVNGKNLLVSRYKTDSDSTGMNMAHISSEIERLSDRKSKLLSIDKETGEHIFDEVDTPKLFVEGSTKDESGVIEPCKRYIGIEFTPNKDLKIAYNLFHGFDIEPVENKDIIKTFKKCFTPVFGKKHLSYMMDWFAHMYQRPDKKCIHALVVKGEKGSGKTTFEDLLGRALLPSSYYFRTANKEQLFGKFNKQLASNLLTVGNELVWGGEHKHDSTLKDMITEETKIIEIKGMDSFTVNSFSRMYFTSNADWVVPATADERRYYVVEAKSVHDKKAWSEFFKVFNEKGAKGALMYEMLNRDLSNFNPKSCPMTDALGEQIKLTQHGIERFVTQGFEYGYFGSHGDLDKKVKCKLSDVDETKIEVEKIRNLYAEMNQKEKGNVKNKISYFFKDILGLTIGRFMVGGSRSTYLILPPKPELEKIVKEKLGIDLIFNY